MAENTPDLVLSVPKGVRQAKRGTRRLVATVCFPPADGAFNHPVVSVGQMAPDGRFDTYPRRAEFTFQRHRRGHALSPGLKEHGGYSSGFLGERSEHGYTKPYAGDVAIRMDDFAFLAHVMAVIERGRTRRRGYRGGEMLDLIVALRWAGVEIHVYSDALRRKRAARASLRRAA